MTKDYKAAYRYARAFFLMMKEKKRAAEANEELQGVCDFSNTHPEFARLLLAPALSDEEKFELIENLLSGGENPVSDGTKNFIKLLVEKNRFNLFGKIVESYRRLFNLDRGVEEVTLAVPFAVSGEQESRLNSVLEKKLGKKIVLSTRIEPGLLGGMVLYTRNQVIDGSFQGKLKGLKQKLISAGREK